MIIATNRGISGGNIIMLCQILPFNSNNSERWNPHIGQAIPNICL